MGITRWTSRARRRAAALVGALVLGLVASTSAGIAFGQVTTPAAGAVVRDGAVPVTEDTGGRHLQADGVTAMTSTQALSCTVRSTANPNARTARSTVTITRDADGAVVFSAVSPNRSSLPTVLNDQSGAWSTTWAIPADAPPGGYTIRSVAENRVRVSALNPCELRTLAFPPVSFEYRPWQRTFHDVLGAGSVSMNIVPAEFQVAVGDGVGAVRPGGPKMTFYAVPDAGEVLLPGDPAACGADPAGCVPAGSVTCDPAAGCDPRLVVISHAPGDEVLQGVFDLETGAFVALAKVDGVQRTLLSLGTEGDAAYGGVLDGVADAAAAQGIDLASVLATTVLVSSGADQLELSLLDGLQLAHLTGPAGVQISTAPSVQAGLVLDIYANLDLTTPCVANVGDSNPDTPAPDRYARARDVGYTVQRSDLLPEVPRAGAAGALVGGPIYSITGDFVGTNAPLVNTATAVIGADTAAGEPNGLPARIQPFVSTPAHVAAPRSLQFLGTATWSASETPVGTSGCLTVDFLLGAGVALLDSPLELDLGALPLWDPADPAVAAAVDAVDAAIADAVGGATADPTVAAVLAQVTGALPPVPGVP